MNREQMILDCQLLSHAASFFMLQEVIKREYAALRKSAKLPPDHPTRVRNRRKQLEYLRLENTINQHLTQLHHEFLRELKLQKAASSKKAHSPAAEEEEDGAPAAADEEALHTEDKEEEGAPAEDPAVEKMMEEQAPAEEEKEEEAPGAAEEEALASQEKEKGAEDNDEAPTNEETAPPAEEQQVPEEEEKEEGAEVGGSAEEHQVPGMEEKTTEEQSPAVEEKEEGADGEEEIIKDPLVEERPTLRKQFRKAIMKRLRRVWVMYQFTDNYPLSRDASCCPMQLHFTSCCSEHFQSEQ
ncbi:neuromodulin-like isoform X1 [Xenopus laevis]|uniref:Neuromodulin-like isoform X1 n=1 Tax=Xenopus laevis TaxID=8355 RepID=A0A8J1LAW1_XENLA|nr:neuromodulin-like isoform X1 [Xenopus laevis]